MVRPTTTVARRSSRRPSSQAYESGRELYVRERRVSDADAAIAYRRREIARLESKLADRTLTVISDTATPEERTAAVLDTKHAAERIGQFKSEISTLERDRARYQQELESYRATVAVGSPTVDGASGQLRHTASTLLPSGSTRNEA
jgi:chromosome segregation ATPase